MTFLLSKRGHRRPTSGFTLVEIMIVVVIIGLLAAMGFPVWAKARRNAQNTAFISDLRIATYAAQTNAFEAGAWAPEVGTGIAPPEFIPYLNKMNWTDPTPIGGHWDWDYFPTPNLTGIRIVGGTVSDTQMAEIDAKIDDGNTATGRFQGSGGNYIYILE